MIPLIESFAFTDGVLVSAIGNSYGDIYEQLFDWSKNSKLNHTDSIFKGMKEQLLPIL
jgi:hypothetical protein